MTPISILLLFSILLLSTLLRNYGDRNYYGNLQFRIVMHGYERNTHNRPQSPITAHNRP
jgi:hypothetical protein